MSALLEEIVFRPAEFPPSEFERLLSQLSERELQEYHQLRIPKRKKQWLAGRLACKESVRRLIQKLEGNLLDPREVMISNSSGHPPKVRLPERFRHQVRISLSHSDHLACAAACLDTPSTLGIGIDLEKVEWIDPSVLPIAFTPSEQNKIKKEYWRLFQFWTAKEALLKALGLGLTVDLREIEISPPFGYFSLNLRFHGVSYPIRTAQKSPYLWAYCRR